MTDLLAADPPAVALYKSVFAGCETVEFPITGLDRTGVPVWVALAWRGGEPLATGVGYGETDGRARTGMWGEMAEGAAVHRLRGLPARRASWREMEASGEAAVDPRRLRLPLGTDWTPDTPRLWTAARRVAPGAASHGEPVWVLLDEAVAHTYNLPGGYDPLYTPITNGLGAGDTRARAAAHGLLELVQRDGNAVGYRALDRGVVVDLDRVERADTRALLARLGAAGIRPVVKLAETPVGMASLYVQGRDDAPAHPWMLTGCGEAAHPDREAALYKAVLEYAASRVRKRFAHAPLDSLAHALPAGYVDRVRAAPPPAEEGRSLAAVRAWGRLSAAEALERLESTWFREAERVPFSSLPTEAVPDDPEALLAAVAGRMAAEGFDVLAVDLSAPGDAVQVVKAVVPGLEVETMTYGRIGPRNVRRLAARIAAGDPLVPADVVGLGPPPDGAMPVLLAPADEAALGGPAWARPDRLAAALGPLYAMYREPPFHAAPLADEREAAAAGRPAA